MSQSNQTILTELIRMNGGYLSGQCLSDKLGVTRTAIWKEIKKLRAQGYTIHSSTNKGYSLEENPYVLSPQLIQSHISGSTNNQVICLEQVDSTITYANRLILDGAENGTVVIADEQTKGVGRLGRSFDSQKGKGLYLSMVIAPTCTADKLTMLTSYAGLAVCYALEQLDNLTPTIKWPNDIILENKKVAGLLTRLVTDGETNTITHGIIGIGINILQDNFPDEIKDKGISLKGYTGKEYMRNQIAGSVITKLNQMFIEEDWLNHSPPHALEDIKKRSCTIGQQVLVTSGDKQRQGKAFDISPSGGLMVSFPQGDEEISFGEVSVRGLLGYV